MKRLFLSSLTFFIFLSGALAQRFSVSFPDSLLKTPFTGNVLLYFSKDSKTPKTGEAGLDIFPCFRLYVKNVKPGNQVIFDELGICTQ